jgi:hypothetical protein
VASWDLNQIWYFGRPNIFASVDPRSWVLKTQMPLPISRSRRPGLVLKPAYGIRHTSHSHLVVDPCVLSGRAVVVSTRYRWPRQGIMGYTGMYRAAMGCNNGL